MRAAQERKFLHDNRLYADRIFLTKAWICATRRWMKVVA